MLHNLFDRFSKLHGLMEKKAAGHQVSSEPKVSLGAVIGIAVFSAVAIAALLLLLFHPPPSSQISSWYPY